MDHPHAVVARVLGLDGLAPLQHANVCPAQAGLLSNLDRRLLVRLPLHVAAYAGPQPAISAHPLAPTEEQDPIGGTVTTQKKAGDHVDAFHGL